MTDRLWIRLAVGRKLEDRTNVFHLEAGDRTLCGLLIGDRGVDPALEDPRGKRCGLCVALSAQARTTADV